MIQDSVIASKETTQKAPLERILTKLRIRRVIPYIPENAVLLDFGCGSHLLALTALRDRAKVTIGIDSYFKSRGKFVSKEGHYAFGSFDDLDVFLQSCTERINVILSLACFEHLESHEFTGVLAKLDAVSTPDCKLLGTVPTPKAKPVLEFLSYKLGLIDPTQIEDHKIYYDNLALARALQGTNWQISKYETFQFGMNSFFLLEKVPSK